MKTTITTAQAMSHPDVCKEITAQIDLSRRKLAVLSDAAALENLYQVSLKQEFDITALTKERDALKADIRQMSSDLAAIEKMRQEKDARMYAEKSALKDAAKLALDALSDERYVARYSQVGEAIAALKAVL